MSKYLTFKKQGHHKDMHLIYNTKEQYLGYVDKQRSGRFMHWCFSPSAECKFTNGCLKEIVQFMTNPDKYYEEVTK